jgi:hypothetical protein
MVWSQLPVATRLPSGEQASEMMKSVCPSQECSSLPVSTSHRRRTLSQEPDRAFLPSGLKATAVMAAGAFAKG